MVPIAKGTIWLLLANEMKVEAYSVGIWEGYYFPGEKRLAHLAETINPLSFPLLPLFLLKRRAQFLEKEQPSWDHKDKSHTYGWQNRAPEGAWVFYDVLKYLHSPG